MIYHFVVGDMAARPLLEAINAEESLQGEVIILKDILNVGPIAKAEGQSFSALRSAFWEEVGGGEAGSVQVDDLEKTLKVSNQLNQTTTPVIWFWMAPLPADVTAYFWLMHYMQKHSERLYVINIAGLPFLDENGKLFFPKSLSETTAKELIKARKLARLVTPSEWELEGDEWQRLVSENAGIRTLEGGKKLQGHGADYYDQLLLNHATIQNMKASRLVQQAMSKNFIPVGDTYLGWRVKELIKSGALTSTSDLQKSLKEIEVQLPGGMAPVASTEVIENSQEG